MSSSTDNKSSSSSSSTDATNSTDLQSSDYYFESYAHFGLHFSFYGLFF